MQQKLMTLLLVAIMGLATMAVSGCDSDKGPAQQAGEQLDQAADDIGDAVDDLTSE